MACRFLSSIESSPLFFHSRPRRREKRWEQCFTFRISWKFKPHGPSQTARSNGGTIRKAREIFLPARGDSPVMHRRIFSEGWSCSSPQSRREWETQKLPPKKKGGSSVLYSGFHGNSNPKGFPKLPGAMAGQFGKRGRFFFRRGPTSPLCTNAFLQRGDPVLLPNPAGNGKHKSSHRRKEVGVVFTKAEPIDKARGTKTKKGLGGASCTLPQPLRMRKLKCMPPPAFRAAFSFPPVKTSCFIGVQLHKKFVVLPADEMVKIPNFYPQVSFLHCAGGGFLLC